MRYPNGLKTEPRLGSDPYYGPRDPIVTPGGTTGSFHTGVDYVGFPSVKAIAGGTVIYAGYNSDYGNEIRVRQADGVVARYCHLAWFAKGTGVGDEVSEGQTVGAMGSTGKARGVHLHFRVDRNNRSFDPRPYLAAGVNGGGGGGFTPPDQSPALRKELDMIVVGINTTPGVVTYTIHPGILIKHGNEAQKIEALISAKQDEPRMMSTDDYFAYNLYNYGLQELSVEAVRAWTGFSPFYVASWLKTGPVAGADIDYDRIIAGIIAGTPKFPTTLTIDPPAATGTLS